ncbi:MAG: hypothetical protein QOE33_1582 [Acidobacteriota bacterium]|nr:hypothetical protein [Acidobacteriota bacterium]
MGYITRLTEQNGYDSPAWIMNLAKLNFNLRGHSFSFLSNKSESFNRLANLSCIDPSELTLLTYQPLGNKYDNFYLFFETPVHKDFIRPGHPKICPQCLSDAAYCRRIWEFILVTVCPIHKCQLIDECPNCNQRITWGRSRLTTCQCKFDWRDSLVLTIPESESRLTRLVFQMCGLLSNGEKPFLPQHTPLLALGLNDLTLAIIFIAGQQQGLSLSTIHHLIPRRKNKDFHKLFTDAFYIFENWPNNYYRFLDWCSAQKRNIPPVYDRLQSVLYKDFGKLYIGIHTTLSSSQFDFMRKAFVNYLLSEWKGVDISAFTRNKDKGRQSLIRYVSKSDAKRLLDVDDNHINYHIEIGKLKTKVRSKGMKRLIFVDVADIARLLREASIRNLDRQ